MKWIEIQNELPPINESVFNSEGCLVIHSVYGKGIGIFYRASEEVIEEMGIWSDWRLYLCTVDFIYSGYEDDLFPRREARIDIFKTERNPDCKNLGTITHWMPFPSPPPKEEIGEK